jgi:two-component system sensor histidine kinase KdpD
MERSRSFENESRVEAARQSEQLRTAVLDALAHDVKTPLTAIRAASSGLLEAHVLDPLHEELVSLIDDESARLEEITNRLLRLARLDARDVRLKRGRLRVERLIRQIVAPARERAPDRIIRMQCGGNLTVSGDEQLLSMALSQLVDNALKYSRPDTGMTVTAERKGADALISVHNLGYPIPEADLERIFERFYRSGDVSHRVAGTGLGLSITRKIALAHGGRVWASSDEARGTTFYLSLPLTEETTK